MLAVQRDLELVLVVLHLGVRKALLVRGVAVRVDPVAIVPAAADEVVVAAPLPV